MTTASMRRMRFTHALLALVLLTVAFSGGQSWDGTAGILAQAIGFLLAAGGTLWRIWTSAFIAGRKDVEVVDSGPYGRCRHPLYFGSFLAGLGIGLTTRSVVITLVLAATLGVVLYVAIRREEADLSARHGAAWRRYRDRVPAFLPGRGSMEIPSYREVNLTIFRKAFLDAASFLGLWLAVLVLDALRTQLAWRTYFTLP